MQCTEYLPVTLEIGERLDSTVSLMFLTVVAMVGLYAAYRVMMD